MTVNLRSNDTFVEDNGWYSTARRYNEFIDNNTVYFKLGIGANTPAIIKYPFWLTTAQNENACYVCTNYGESFCPTEIKQQSVCINDDISGVISDLLNS